jgi:hypothetical protein
LRVSSIVGSKGSFPLAPFLFQGNHPAFYFQYFWFFWFLFCGWSDRRSGFQFRLWFFNYDFGIKTFVGLQDGVSVGRYIRITKITGVGPKIYSSSKRVGCSIRVHKPRIYYRNCHLFILLGIIHPCGFMLRD